ncbi:beta-galactosidase trimerization domain-containing protein [Devosia sp. 1635]|uniref:beta-galactosidase trimerization domain-containing protein n=1 Tax=Devosia sp. 1635 TaxID=2726066 RepID=UPI00156505C7|nr:beta-galactosidase trimerization domain-containing protein [Devosia sp. 1635]
MSIGAEPSTNNLATEGTGWWRSPFSVFQTNLQEVDAVMDVEKVLDIIEEHGADTWLINTGGIVSFYPSDLPFQTRNPFLVERKSGDLIGDAVAAAHKRGVKVLARCDFSKMATGIAQEHPDWLFVSPKGELQIYNTLYSACPSADYYQHRSLDILDEIMDRYPVDGFFFNWFGFSETDYSRVYHGVCHCEKCQATFSEYSGGKELPDGPDHPNYPEWLRFSNGVIRTLATKISDHILARRPDAGLILSRGAPIIYYEANNAFGRELWHHATSENVSAHMTGLPEISLMVNSVSFVDMPYRMAGEQPELFAQYLLQAIARGGNPSTYIMGAPGRIPYANLPLAGEVSRFFRDHKDVYAKLQPGGGIALARPDRLRAANPGYGESVEEFRGLYSAFKEKHIPFDVIGADLIAKMDAEGLLKKYKLVVLPDLGSLGSDAAAALDRFVTAGGDVVLTGSSGITAHGGVEMVTAPSIMRVGTPDRGQALWATYVSTSEQPAAQAFHYAAPTVPVYGSYAHFVWKPTAERIGVMLPQAPFGPPEKCYGHVTGGEPAAAGASRNGRVIQIPWTVGRTYREFGTSEVRDYFLGTIEKVLQTEVEAMLPEQVEMIVGRDDAGLVIHLINQTGARRKSFGPHVPVEGGTLRIKGASGTADFLVSGSAANISESEDGIEITLPRLDLYEVIRVPLAK